MRRLGIPAMAMWNGHRHACLVCAAVVMSRTGTYSLACYTGAVLLKEALCELSRERLAKEVRH